MFDEICMKGSVYEIIKFICERNMNNPLKIIHISWTKSVVVKYAVLQDIHTILISLQLICIMQLVVTFNKWSIQGTVFLLIVLLHNGYL